VEKNYDAFGCNVTGIKHLQRSSHPNLTGSSVDDSELSVDFQMEV